MPGTFSCESNTAIALSGHSRWGNKGIAIHLYPNLIPRGSNKGMLF